MSKRLWSVIVLVSALLWAVSGWAEPEPDPRAKKPNPPHTVKRLVFGDDEVVAGRDTGAGQIIGGRVAPKQSRLIVIRTDFIPELIKSAEDL